MMIIKVAAVSHTDLKIGEIKLFMQGTAKLALISLHGKHRCSDTKKQIVS